MTLPRIDGLDINYYINSNFEYWQRIGGSSVAITNAFELLADRWEVGKGGTWTVNGQRSTDVPNIALSQYSFEVAGTVGDLVNDGMVYRQKMESIFARKLANTIVSFSMKVKTNNMKQVRLRLSTPTVKDIFSTLNPTFVDDTVSIVDDTTWQEVKFENISIPANAINGIDTKISVIDATGLVATNIKVSEIKMSIGTKVQAFSLMGRNVVEELQLCQRYYEIFSENITAYGTSDRRVHIFFKQRKRINPVILFDTVLSSSITVQSEDFAEWGAPGVYAGVYNVRIDAEL